MHHLIKIDCSQIKTMQDLHAVFKSSLGFPDFYGNNMDAWIDCMSYLDEPTAGMTTVHVETGEFLVLQLNSVKAMVEACPTVYEALSECVAFVNFRRIESGEAPILALSYHTTSS